MHVRTTPGRLRALTALLLLGPTTPLLFQGQEFAASSPFFFFGNPSPQVAEKLREGRQKFLQQFPSLATESMQAQVPNPAQPELFERSKLDHGEREVGWHGEMLALHRDLLQLRRQDPTIRAGQRRGAIDGAVLGPDALVIRWFDPSEQGDDRLLLVNLGVELRLTVDGRASAGPARRGPAMARPLVERRTRLRWRRHGRARDRGMELAAGGPFRRGNGPGTDRD